MEKARIYYDKGGQIVYHMGLEGVGEFPLSVEEQFEEHPEAVGVIELSGSEVVDDYMRREGSRVDNDKLILGDYSQPLSPPEPPRDLAAEIDGLEAKIEELEKKVV